MTETFVRVCVAVRGTGERVINGYVGLERRTNSHVPLLLKVEHILQFPQEDWLSHKLENVKGEDCLSVEVPLSYDSHRTQADNTVMKLGSFGTRSRQQWNYCFPKYDRYPTPLMSESFASQRTGKHRWTFAIWYLQPSRFKEILQEEMKWWSNDQKRGDVLKAVLNQPNKILKMIKDYADLSTLLQLDETYCTGIVSLLCEQNHPSNFAYPDNKQSYEKCFRIFVDVLRQNPSFCAALWTQTKNNSTRWGPSEMTHISQELEDRPEWVDALTKVGFPLLSDAKRQRKE